MYKRTEKARKQRPEQKDEIVYLGTQPEHPRDEEQKIQLKKTPEEDEDGVIYLGTQLEHPRDKFRKKTKIKLKKEAEFQQSGIKR